MITEIEILGSNFLDYDCEISGVLIGRSILPIFLIDIINILTQ